MKTTQPNPRGAFHLPFGLYPLTFLVSLCIVCPRALLADEFSQTSHLSARMFSYGTLMVDTRMGDLHIEGWDTPRVEIEVERVVRAKSAATAQPLYRMIQVRLDGADKEVRLSTQFPSRKLWRPFRDESKLSVNFRIRMPFDSNLKLKCVDGDVRIEGIVGREELRVNYGDVEIDVPSLYGLRSLQAHTWLGYVQSDLQGMGQDSAGLSQRLSFWNRAGTQDIQVKVRMGGVFVYRDGD